MKRFALFVGVGAAAWALYVVVTRKPGVPLDVAFKVPLESYGVGLGAGIVGGAALAAWLTG